MKSYAPQKMYAGLENIRPIVIQLASRKLKRKKRYLSSVNSVLTNHRTVWNRRQDSMEELRPQGSQTPAVVGTGNVLRGPCVQILGPQLVGLFREVVGPGGRGA